MKRITRTILTLATTVAIAALSASAALAGDNGFVPGVTDFPARPAVFVPGVTDFPQRPAIQTPSDSGASAGGIDWSDVGIAAAAAALLGLLAVAAVAALRRRSRAALGTAALGVAVLAASVGGGIDLNHNETVLRD